MVLSLYYDLMTFCFYLLATQDEGQLGEAHQFSIALPEVTAGNGTFFAPCTCSQLFLRIFRPPNFLLEERYFWISYLKIKQGKQSASLCETSFSVTTWKKLVSPSCLSKIYWQVRILKATVTLSFLKSIAMLFFQYNTLSDPMNILMFSSCTSTRTVPICIAIGNFSRNILYLPIWTWYIFLGRKVHTSTVLGV